MPMANLSCCFSQCSDLSHFNLYLYFQNEEVEEEEQEGGKAEKSGRRECFVACGAPLGQKKRKEKNQVANP